MTKTPLTDRQLVRMVTALLVGGIAVLLDSTIVSVAVHSLAVDLDATLTQIQWVSTGYLLALGVAVPLAVWAQGRLGGRRLWLTGLVVFLVGSVAASLAPGVGSLVAARAVQGIGGGILIPLMATLPMQAAAGRVTGRMMAAVSLPMVLGPVLGPLVGGAVLHWLTWRWMFWINVPLLVVGFVLARRRLPDDASSRRRTRLDVVGAVLLPAGLVGVLYGLSEAGGAHGFDHARVLVPLATGAALVVGFVAHAVRSGSAALVDVRLLRVRSVGSASAAMAVTGASLYGAMLLLPLYWQQVRGVDPLTAGLMLVPQGLGSVLSRTLAGRLTDRFGARAVTFVACLVVAVTTVPFAFAGAHTSGLWLVTVLVARGFGLGGVMIPVMAVAFRDATAEQVPHASVLTRIGQQVGGAFGTAVLAVALQNAARTSGDVEVAFHHAFWWATAFAGLAVAAALWLPGRRAAEPAAAPEPELVSQA